MPFKKGHTWDKEKKIFIPIAPETTVPDGTIIDETEDLPINEKPVYNLEPIKDVSLIKTVKELFVEYELTYSESNLNKLGKHFNLTNPKIYGFVYSHKYMSTLLQHLKQCTLSEIKLILNK